MQSAERKYLWTLNSIAIHIVKEWGQNKDTLELQGLKNVNVPDAPDELQQGEKWN